MKYVFASVLVLLALVLVFHPETAISVPRTVARVITGSVAKHMPFSVKTEYVASCMDGLRDERDAVRYQVSDTAVNIREVEKRIADLEAQRAKSLARIQRLVAMGDAVPKEQLAREVTRFDQIQAKLTHGRSLHNQMAGTLKSLARAEGDVSDKVGQMADRLEMVKLDHTHNNARELAAKLTDPEYHGYKSVGTHCAEVIGKMEHEERVREDMYQRYGPAGDQAASDHDTDAMEKAQAILRANGCSSPI
jgi:phage shock protein A